MTREIFNHPRTELKSTVIFGEQFTLDSRPLATPSGRLVPGPLFSSQEYEKLTQLSKDQADTLELFVLPTVTQLARISLNATTGAGSYRHIRTIKIGHAMANCPPAA